MITILNNLKPFLLGMLVGCSALLVILSNTDSAHNRYMAAITECQAELPRNVKCVIYAKPEAKKL